MPCGDGQANACRADRDRGWPDGLHLAAELAQPRRELECARRRPHDERHHMAEADQPRAQLALVEGARALLASVFRADGTCG